MNSFNLAAFLLDLTDSCQGQISIATFSGTAIALILCIILIYQELRYRRRIQSLLTEIEMARTAFEANHKHVEKKLQESEACLQTLIDNLPFNCWICDAEGRHVMQNTCDVQQWGNLIGLRYEDTDIPSETLQLFIENRQRVLSGEIWRSEWQSPSGPEGQTLMSIMAPVYSNQEIQGLLGVTIDITEQKQTEKALRQQEEQYRQIVETATEGIWVLDHENRTAFVNQQMAKMLGYSVDEMLGQSIFAFMDEAGQEIAVSNIERRRQGIQEQHDFKFRCQNGADLWAIVSATPLFDDEQNYIGTLGMITDITDRKQLEHALQASEVKLKDIFNSAVAAITSLRVFADGRWQIDQVSAGCEFLSGYTSAELTLDDHLWINRIEPEDWQAIAPHVFTNIFAGRTDSYEYRLHHKDGSVRWISQTNNSRWDETQQCWVVTAISVDITDRKSAEIALRESEATNRALISAVPDLLIWMNHDGSYLDALGGSKNLKLTKPLPELTSSNVYNVLPQEQAQRRMHYIQQALQTNELQVYEYQLEIEGDIRDEEARIAVCGEQQVLCIVRDITDRKRAERALQQKEDFLQLLLDTIPEQIFWKDRQSIYLGCNRLFAKAAGLNNRDIIDKTDFDLPWDVGQAERFRREDQLILATGQPLLQSIERRLEAGGEKIWARVNKVPIPDAEGNLIGLLGTIENITERKQAEEALRSRHQELLTLHRIAEITLRSQSSQLIFQGIVEEISVATGFPIVAIELYDAVRQVMVFEGVKGISSGDGILEVPVGQSLSGKVAQTGQAIVKHYVPGEHKHCDNNQSLSQLNIKTFVCLPMTVSQDTMGVLSLSHPDIIQIDNDILRWLESLANYLALITHRQHLEASLQQANVDLGIQVAEQTLELREVIAQLQQEICDRQQTEIALRESEERFRRVFDHSPIGIAVANVTDNQFVMVNRTFCQLLGYTEAELLTQSCISVSHPDDREKDKPFATQMISGEINSYQMEKRYLKKNQQVVWANLTATAVRDQDGDVVYIVGMVQDITERKQAQLALQEAHEKLTRWVNDLEQRNQEMTLLNEMSDLMQACLTVDEAYIVIAQFMPRLFPDCSGAVYMIGEPKSLVEAVATWGELIALQLFTSNDCFALRRGQPHYVQDTHTSLCCQHLPDPLPTSYFCVPMVAQGETAGVLYLSLPTQPLTDAKQQLATTVARQIALAIANLKLYATLQNQSIRDSLTGLFNRRYLNEFLARELRRAERNQQVLSMLLLDVDYFKKVNDTFGHDAGDAVLRHISRFLQESVRHSDIACRYGGEEMVLILPNVSLDDAMQRAEQLRQGVKRLKVEHPQSLGVITVSIGVACFPAHGSTCEALLQMADLALYQAKATGRDRVVMASDPVSCND